MEGLNWETSQISLGAGLMQRQDDRVRQPPYLDRAVDIQYDELGGIQLRKPYGQSETGDVADRRRMVEFGDELLVFTKDALYSYAEGQEALVSRGTYLAIKPTETPRFVSTGDQHTCDRAEVGGAIAHVWVDGSNVYLAMTDAATGAVIKTPTGFAGSKPRLVALTAKALLFYVSAAGALQVAIVDPGDPSGSPLTTTELAAAAVFNSFYDATRVLGTSTACFAYRRDTTTSYSVGVITEALVVTETTKARTCDGPIAIASHPSGTQVAIVRANGTDVEGDLITIAAFADVHVNEALSTEVINSIEAVTASYRSVAESGTTFRCLAFWHVDDSGVGTPQVRYNYVDTAGAVGTDSLIGYELGLASRAFDHDGRVFVHTVFDKGSLVIKLQNTLFLHRDDALLCGKFLAGRAGGDLEEHLPTVQRIATNTYTTCATMRRRIPLQSSDSYSDRGPCDVTIEFDSNEARRTARLGQTLYIAGAEVMQYDGVQLTEVGFHIAPGTFAVVEAATGPILVNGTYAFKAGYRWDNAKGERERSTNADVIEFVVTAQPAAFEIDALPPLVVTHKTNRPVAVEVWRTKVDPQADSPFHLITATDPADSTNPNKYLENDTTASAINGLDDELTDTLLADREAHPENGVLLEGLAPPAATLIAADDRRLFLGGVSGDPDRVLYSKIRNEAVGQSEVASFNDEALGFNVPPLGGAMTALAADKQIVIVWRETATYVYAGVGFGNFGDADGSQNFELVRTFGDCGAVGQETVALTDAGWVFKSAKGWYVLTRGLTLEYIGAAIADYDSETVHAVTVLTAQHQIRILTESRMLVLDTVAKQWCEWTISDAVHACMWRGVHTYITDDQVFEQETVYSGNSYSLDVETAWIKPADLQGFVRLRRLLILGEYRSAHDLRIRIAYDYLETYVDDVTWTVSPTTVGGPEQVKIGPSRQQCQAFKVRITSQAVGSATPSNGEALKLTGLGVELGYRKGLHRRLPAAQKAGA